MSSRLPVKTLLAPAPALAFHFPSEALACRIGVDQQLFEESPPMDALPGAQIIHVRFSNAREAIGGLPPQVPDPYGGGLGYTLIGVAQPVDEKSGAAKQFPVYAFVTSCSFFHAMTFAEGRTAIQGDYYLIGRFAPDVGDKRFYAGGRRSSGGENMHDGFHF